MLFSLNLELKNDCFISNSTKWEKILIFFCVTSLTVTPKSLLLKWFQ